MRDHATPSSHQSQYRFFVLAPSLAWSVILASLFVWSILCAQQFTRDGAIAQARAQLNRDIVFRLWASAHGGVYVPIDENTPPNPYLAQLPERDVQTPAGIRLTLMNPAYIMRQLNEMFGDSYGATSRLTSLKPLRPENAPDDWERAALQIFTRDRSEILEFTNIRGEPYLRLIQPMITQPGCLKCHAAQGYQVGDVRGAASLAVPLTGWIAQERQLMLRLALALGLVWLIGSAGIGWMARRLGLRAEQRHRVESALRASEARFRTIADFTYDWEYWRGADGKFIYCTPSCARITGYRAQEFVDDPGLMERIIHPEDQPFVVDHLHDAANGSGAGALDFRVIRRDGATRWIGHVCQPVHDDAGKFIGTRASNRDISERKAVEEKLRLQTTALQVAANSIFITDRAGTIMFVNAAFTNLTGYTAREAIGKNPRELIRSGKQAKPFYKNLWDTALAGQVWRGEMVNRKKNGELYTQELSITPVRLTRDRVTHFVAVAVDITSRRQAEFELARSNALLRATLDSTAEGILAIGQQGEIASFNQKFVEMWQMSDEIMALPLDERLRRHAARVEDSERFFARTQELLAHPELVAADVFEFKNGAIVERISTPYRLGGYIVGRLFSFRDITERKRLERELQTRRALAATGNLNDALNRLLDAALSIHDVDCGGVYVVEPRAAGLDLVAQQGLPPESVATAAHYDADTPQARLALEGKPVYVRFDALALPRDQAHVREGLRAFATVPIQHDGQVIAALVLASHTHNEISNHARATIESIAAQIGSVIARARGASRARVRRKISRDFGTCHRRDSSG